MALWQNSTDDKHNTNPAIQRPEASTASEGTLPNIASENRPENPELQTTETGTPSQLITPNIPTENTFLPLQDSKESDTPFNRRQEISDLVINPGNNSPKARDTPPTPAVVNKAIFLCDSDGKFLDKRKLFPSG